MQFATPTDDFELVNKSITSLLDYNEVKAITPGSPINAIKTETEYFICYRLSNKNNANIYLTIKKNAINNLNELQGISSDGNHRNSLGIVKAMLEHKLTYNL